MIVEPNEDEIERKSADKIKINYGTDHIDYLYGIGRCLKKWKDDNRGNNTKSK